MLRATLMLRASGGVLKPYLLYTLASQSFRGALSKRQAVPQMPIREPHPVWAFVFLGHESKGQRATWDGIRIEAGPILLADMGLYAKCIA